MEIKVIQREGIDMKLLVQGVDVPFMNALRRLIVAEVPCMAIDEIVMLENSSIVPDEMIAHRLGLVPIKTDLESYNLPEECPCKSEFGCNICRVTLTLDAEAKEETRTVYSGEMVSENPAIVPVSDKIPIAKLAKEQKIRLEAYARLGRGKNHAKWQPTSKCAYKYMPRIEIGKTCDACGKCVEACPKKIIVKTGNKIETREIFTCTMCQDCAETCPKEAIKVSWEQDAFIFNIESNDVLPPERIVKEAVTILDKQLKEVESQVRVKKSDES